jgi:hypothetical protein
MSPKVPDTVLSRGLPIKRTADDSALLPHVMVHDGEQDSYGLVVSEPEGCRIDAAAVVAHIKS